MTPLQRAVKLYPNLLNDEYFKTILREIKNSLVKQYKAGKLEINGKYTYLLPDFYASCEYWFGHIKDPSGLLSDGEVFCRLYKNHQRLDCLRSPHLFKEHAVRINAACEEWNKKDDKIHRWFGTNAVYTSCKDLISKILQFDVDGDKSLVIADEAFVELAVKNMAGIVPLYYDMRKSAPQILSNKTIYDGLHAAFTGSNIGLYSNDISKIWNSDVFLNGDTAAQKNAIDVVRLLCMENNFLIDYAKTLYKPERPKEIHKQITAYTKANVPAFFIYAKDKNTQQTAVCNSSTVNRLSRIIPNPRLNFRSLQIGKPDYRLLMNNPLTQTDPAVISAFKKESRSYHFRINNTDDSYDNIRYLVGSIRRNLSATGYSDQEICDMLVSDLYGSESKSKEALWCCYGDIIADNLAANLKPKKTKFIQCADCGEWIEISADNKRTSRCAACQSAVKRNYERLKKRKQRQINTDYFLLSNEGGKNCFDYQ